MTSQPVTSIVPLPASDAPPALHEIVARRVGAILGQYGITRLALARAMGISGPGLSMKLNGQRAIDLHDLEALAAALNVTPALLVTPMQPTDYNGDPEVISIFGRGRRTSAAVTVDGPLASVTTLPTAVER